MGRRLTLTGRVTTPTNFPPAGKSEEEHSGASAVSVDFRVGRPSEAVGDTTWTTTALKVSPNYRNVNAFVKAQVLARVARLIGL